MSVVIPLDAQHIKQAVLRSVADYAPAQAITHCWIAYSGGLDSTVLLHLLAQARLASAGICLQAIHINHGLQADAAQWVIHCRKISQQWQIPLTLVEVNAANHRGESPEAAARKARYDAFDTVITPQAILLTAHQQDDQAETLLLQLLRGAGPRGLAAMPVVAPLGSGLQVRPLLGMSRQQLEAYAMHHQLTWIDDPSNQDRRFTRNFIRHDILPQLQSRWPSVSNTLSRSATLCAEAISLCDELAGNDFSHVMDGHPHCLSLTKLLALSARRQRNLLIYWLRVVNYPIPSCAILHTIQTSVLQAAKDRQPIVQWAGVAIRRFAGRLYALPYDPSTQAGHWSTQRFSWDLITPLIIPNLGTLSSTQVKGLGLPMQCLAEKKISVRFRQGGEQVRLAGRNGHQRLKKLFQEAQVPPWERDQIPLLYRDEELIAVVGYWYSQSYQVAKTQAGVHLLFDYFPPRPCG